MGRISNLFRENMKVRILWGIFGLITAQDSLQYAEYDLSVYIRNRYVVNTVQVRVENTGPDASEYKFAVDLEKMNLFRAWRWKSVTRQELERSKKRKKQTKCLIRPNRRENLLLKYPKKKVNQTVP